MITKDRYENFDPRVREYMGVLIDGLAEEYGQVDDQWLISLDLLATTYSAYYIGWDAVQRDGMYITDSRGRIERNPGLQVMTNTQAHIQRILTSFALTPYSKSKMKAPEREEENDYLDSLEYEG